MSLRSVTVFAVALLAGGCAPASDTIAHDGYHADIAYSSDIANIVPRQVFDFIMQNEWGNYHLGFHSLRRWYRMNDDGRQYWARNGYGPADLQEGDPRSGLEFLAMHHAMISKLHEEFDGLGYGPIFDGWNTEELLQQHVAEYVRTHGQFPDDAARTAALADLHDFIANAVAKLRRFDDFADDDAFGLYLQTKLRLGDLRPDQPSDWRNYDTVDDKSAGLHNSLHNILSDSSSPIDVGDPAVNLSNQLFWGIHGFVEAISQEFHAAYRVRMGYADGEDDPAYLDAADLAGLHIQVHSHQYVLDTKPPAQKLFDDSPQQTPL